MGEGWSLGDPKKVRKITSGKMWRERSTWQTVPLRYTRDWVPADLLLGRAGRTRGQGEWWPAGPLRLTRKECRPHLRAPPSQGGAARLRPRVRGRDARKAEEEAGAAGRRPPPHRSPAGPPQERLESALVLVQGAAEGGAAQLVELLRRAAVLGLLLPAARVRLLDELHQRLGQVHLRGLFQLYRDERRHVEHLGRRSGQTDGGTATRVEARGLPGRRTGGPTSRRTSSPPVLWVRPLPGAPAQAHSAHRLQSREAVGEAPVQVTWALLRLGFEIRSWVFSQVEFCLSSSLPWRLDRALSRKSNYFPVRTTGEVLLLPFRIVFRDVSKTLQPQGYLWPMVVHSTDCYTHGLSVQWAL